MAKEEIKEEKETKISLKEKILPIIILIVGIAICGTLVFFGVRNIIATNKEVTKTQEHMSLEEIEQREKELKEEEKNLVFDKNQEFDKGGFSKKYYEIASRLSDINEEQSKLSSERFKIEHGFYEQDKVENGISIIVSGMIFLVPAIMVLIISLIASKAMKARHMIEESIMSSTDVFHSIASQIKDKNSTYKEFKCPNCGAKLAGKEDEEVCEYCGAKLHKTSK